MLSLGVQTCDLTPPTVGSTSPLDNATGVPLNTNVTATFDKAMDPASLTKSTFVVTSEPSGTRLLGTVIYSNLTATFWPAAPLASNASYKATITTGVRSSLGVNMAAKKLWTFTTGTTVAPGMGVNLGQAGNYAILAKTGVSSVPASVVIGNVGVSPIFATAITGFSLTADATNVFSTSPQVTGKLYAADYALPTPTNLTTAVSDMETAFTDAAGRAPGVTELGAGTITGGTVLAPGVYKWGTGLLIPTNVTLNGSGTDVWIFQIAQDLTLSSGAQVLLSGGAQPENVFWQVAGLVDLGTTAHCEGVILTQTAVTLRTGATINGRLLAQTRVNLDQATVVEPAP